jgi:hypothetical protein
MQLELIKNPLYGYHEPKTPAAVKEWAEGQQKKVVAKPVATTKVLAAVVSEGHFRILFWRNLPGLFAGKLWLKHKETGQVLALQRTLSGIVFNTDNMSYYTDGNGRYTMVRVFHQPSATVAGKKNDDEDVEEAKSDLHASAYLFGISKHKDIKVPREVADAAWEESNNVPELHLVG